MNASDRTRQQPTQAQDQAQSHPAAEASVAASQHPSDPHRRWFGLAAAAACTGLAAPGWAQQAPAGAKEFVIGVLPNVSARILLAAYQPMRTHFERELKRPVVIATAANFKVFATNTLRGDYDMVVTAPNLGRVMQLDGGWDPLAIYEPRIPALAVSLAANKDDSPQQVKGKAVAMANPQSLVALVAMQWLKAEGLEAGRDFKTVVTANDDSLGAVLNSGEAPWAVMSMGEFRAKPEALRQTLRIVRQITTVPGFYVMANPKLAADERARLKSLVLGFPPSEDGKRFFELSGFKNIRAMVSEDQTFLDPFNDVTRSSLGLKR